MPSMTRADADPTDTRVEQRAHPRCGVNVRCWISDGRVQRYATLVDISMGGARVATAAPPPVGGLVTMKFSLSDDSAPIEADARIVWRAQGFRGRGGVMGLHFTGVADLSGIQAYLTAK